MPEADTQYREGFRIKQAHFVPPADLSHLNSVSRQEVTICNLFANQKLSIPDICRVLDEPYCRVVHVLILGGLVHERRSLQHAARTTLDRRHSFFKTLH